MRKQQQLEVDGKNTRVKTVCGEKEMQSSAQVFSWVCNCHVHVEKLHEARELNHLKQLEVTIFITYIGSVIVPVPTSQGGEKKFMGQKLEFLEGYFLYSEKKISPRLNDDQIPSYKA